MSFFNPLKVSSKFAICGLPLRLDTYRDCGFKCDYCFSMNRRRGHHSSEEPNIQWLHNKFCKVYDEGDVDKSNFLEVLLKDRVTLHGGGMSDCFQYREDKYHHTHDIVELCNNYEQTILFSTKTDNTYNVPIKPELHSFQLSITNTRNIFEKNAPPFTNRLKFYKKLKDEGYKVGIRVQPFLPNITDFDKIVECFGDADHFTIESIKLVNGNNNNIELLKRLKLKKHDFTQLGLLNLKPSIRLNYYEKIINLLKEKGLSYSIADNDLHYIGNNECCCGDRLIAQYTKFNNTTLLQRYGKDYTLTDVFDNSEDYWECKCSSLFNSDRRNDCTTVAEFYLDRFHKSSSPFSPQFQYYTDYRQTKLI